MGGAVSIARWQETPQECHRSAGGSKAQLLFSSAENEASLFLYPVKVETSQAKSGEFSDVVEFMLFLKLL